MSLPARSRSCVSTVGVGLVVIIVLAGCVAAVPGAPATRAVAYSVTNGGANARRGPTTSASIVRFLPHGTPVSVVCQGVGGMAGMGPHPHNATWDHLTDGTWVHDHWLTTPGDRPRIDLGGGAYAVFTTGLSRCPSSSAHPQATVAVSFAARVSSSPIDHHIAYGGDWSADLAAPAGTPVRASFPIASGRVALEVVAIGDACPPPASGGKRVTVRVAVSGVVIGHVVYSHLAGARGPGPLANGEVVGTLATGLPIDPWCWTGPHLHLELDNSAGAACFLLASGWLAAGTAVGVLGGHLGAGLRQPCPAGA